LLPIPAADLSYIPYFVDSLEKVSSATITVEKFASVLSKAKPHKAPCPDASSVFVLKLLGRPHLKYLQALF
jgi:hypothetical protein